MKRRFDSLRRVYKAIVSADPSTLKKTLGGLFFTGLILIAVMFVGLFLIGSDPEHFGQRGDFFGGILNPLLTFLTFTGVIFTILLQQVELTETREELRRQATALETQLGAISKQNFEATFFQMLTLHNSIVNSMDLLKSDKLNSTLGRDCFKSFTRQLKVLYDKAKGSRPTASERVLVESAYSSFWVKRRQDLGHYFRYLFNIIRFVDEAVLAVGDEPEHVVRTRYMKLLRAQLSDHELVLLFYNCIHPNGRRFAQYVRKYDLLDNMPPTLLFSELHLDEFPELGHLNELGEDS